MANLEPLQRALLDEPVPRAAGPSPGQGIERRFDVGFVAELALKEKQIQQNVRPVIAVHKWFARRPGTLFRALLLSELAEGPLHEIFDRPHRFDGLRVADPFMGGGTPLFEANRLGCDVTGWDVNPMAYWVVRQELLHLDVGAYREAARAVETALEEELRGLYRTRCTRCGEAEAPVKYFLWVKVQACRACGEELDLLPGRLIAADQRHPRNVLLCSGCGALTEVEDRDAPGPCSECAAPLTVEGPARRGRCACPACGEEARYPDPEVGAPRHRMIALEYHCWRCKPTHEGRFFKRPDADDLARYAEAEERLEQAAGRLRRFIPSEEIPPGDESDRLHRWGYRRWREMFNARQLLGLARLAEEIAAVPEERVRHALATNLSDLLRYQNMLCRYDTRSLKSLDVFSVHGFPVGLIQAESNLLGIQHPETGRNVGSGGWTNVVEKLARAKEYCEAPFEIRYEGRSKRIVPVPGEWIGDRQGGDDDPARRVDLRCASATETELPEASLDAVLTDPPYYANVQYAELMDFCYAWLRRLVGDDDPVFAAPSTRRAGDLTGNQTLERGLEEFVAGLSEVYSRMARALVPGGPFAFTYHHNDLEAYRPVVVALLDAGLVCTAALPCPAEMAGSIHIHKSESSIIDTVFVCRTTGRVLARQLGTDPASVARLVGDDLARLRAGCVRPTRGDARCITYGHLARLAVWRLREGWDANASWGAKLGRAGAAMAELASWEEVRERLEAEGPLASRSAGIVCEERMDYGVRDVEIAF
jgi:adenine-specific DNA methylase